MTQDLMRISYSFRILVFAGVYLFMTSFNTNHHGTDKTNKIVAKIIHKWYELHIDLEKNDVTAYPPIAARRAAELGLAGMIVWHTKQQLFSQNIFTFASVLNETYARTLQQAYSTVPTAKVRIEKLRIDISDHLPNSPLIQKNSNECIEFLSEISPAWSTQSAKFQQCSYGMHAHCIEENSDSVLQEWQDAPVFIKGNRNINVNPPALCTQGEKSVILQEAMAVFYVGQHLSYEEKWVAEFWSDDVRGLTFSPVGRWISITKQLVRQHPLPADQMFNLYFSLGISLNDAVTLCWKYKYLYKIPRPSQIIQCDFDPQWKPLHDNPMFPSYPSGHAAIGSAACTILNKYFGDNIEFTDHSHHQRIEFLSHPRKFKNFTSMAEENALSRIYMGVHYPMDCEEGLNIGKQVGINTKNLPFTTFLKDYPKITNPDYCTSERLTRYK